MHYDIIGDIHGCAKTLIALLEKLGYQQVNNIYQHPTRKAIFLGDFIDRGPLQRDVIDIVRPMVESQHALAVMGNHEFNAIAYATPNPSGDGFLRKHNEKNKGQHYAFLEAYKNEHDYVDVINWFKTLPLWIDKADLRVVHACWDSESITAIRRALHGESIMHDQFIKEASTEGTWQFNALEIILKGKEIPLPQGKSFLDKDKNPRHHIRVRWWDKSASNFQEAFLGPEEALSQIPDDDIQGEHLVEYTHDAPPVFLGHYWLVGETKSLAHNIACVDYAVGKENGKLVAYQWQGEQTLNNNHFVKVDRVDAPNIEVPK